MLVTENHFIVNFDICVVNGVACAALSSLVCSVAVRPEAKARKRDWATLIIVEHSMVNIVICVVNCVVNCAFYYKLLNMCSKSCAQRRPGQPGQRRRCPPRGQGRARTEGSNQNYYTIRSYH